NGTHRRQRCADARRQDSVRRARRGREHSAVPGERRGACYYRANRSHHREGVLVRLEGAAALVTGAGRRLGQAIAIGLAKAGCDVAVHYNGSRQGAEATANAVREIGRRAELLQADLTDAKAARGLADQAARALKRLDVVINSAAIMVREPVDTVTPESWDATLDLN